MEKYLKEHIYFIENALQKENDNFDWSSLSDFNRTQIEFFQHERLVHLLITLFFGLMFCGFVSVELGLISAVHSGMFLENGFLIVGAILLVALGFYIRHYFILENSVQKLYRLEREIMKRCQKYFL